MFLKSQGASRRRETFGTPPIADVVVARLRTRMSLGKACQSTKATRSVVAIAVAGFTGFACSGPGPAISDDQDRRTSEGRRPSPSPTHSVSTDVERALIERGPLQVAMPRGYEDITADVSKPDIVLVMAAKSPRLGYQPTITFQKVPRPGGSFDDPKLCAQTGRALTHGDAHDPGVGGSLTYARIVHGPVGKTCQVHLVAPQGVAIITELHKAGNTPANPKDLCLMTCNHADGDVKSETICRATLATFRFRNE